MARARWGLLFGLLLSVSPFAQARSHPHHSAHAAAAIPAIAVAELPPEARDTLQLIRQGGPFPYARDGVVFGNYEHKLPELPRGCTSDSAPPCRARYREYTVKTPGARDRGPRRIVCGPVPECYYSDDHYRSFRRIKE